ncbi:methyltransferase [Actinomadura madurae]|uniref:Dimerisation domain-containing protein n=1 Tax=Actinomadura madurae TaxID=1993 RepID=A0A1I5FB11_9ACTN|nr:methyltransferase [Actinomadura madurae]SFO20922.1 Dimerisation domain-containing protein [Actinomadura madurae]SPT60304.1 Multifunctional cyclase-dehydratase-3-O-methyl transferase tcmN [Actinomadura madurae]
MDPELIGQMMDLTTRTWVSQAVSVAAELGVADTLADGPRHVDDIARTVGADADALYRLLRALSDLDLFRELEGRRFASTPLGDVLGTGVPGSLRDWAIMTGRPFHREAWTALAHTVRTGEPAFEHVHGAMGFDHFRDHPADGQVLNAAMTAVSGLVIAPVVAACEFEPGSKIVDVGGGHGALLAAILAADPDAHGVVFDLPHVVDGAGRAAEDAGVADRCEYIGGDFFESVPSGGDAYVLSNIVHDWDDGSAVRILANCRDAMNPNGRVLLLEAVLPDDIRPSRAKWIDLEMLIMARGARQRTGAEYAELLNRAGLHLTRVDVDHDAGAFGVIEAVPLRM